MNIEEFREYCLSKKGANESTPFDEDTLVFKVLDKMFTATGIEGFASFTMKCDPEKVEELREQFSCVQVPAYFSKKHWNRILVDGSVPDEQLREWLDDSYDLVVAKMTKKQQAELKGID